MTSLDHGRSSFWLFSGFYLIIEIKIEDGSFTLQNPGIVQFRRRGSSKLYCVPPTLDMWVLGGGKRLEGCGLGWSCVLITVWRSSVNFTLLYRWVGRELTRWGCFLPVLIRFFFPDFVLKPKARTGISKPYNVKQIKTTNAQEAEAAIRCLLEARGGGCSPGALLPILLFYSSSY